MKETLEYFYLINDVDLNEKNDKYYFSYNGFDYLFEYCYLDEKELLILENCFSELKYKNLNWVEFVYNIDNKLLTKYGNINYILIKGKNFDEVFTIDNINYYSKLLIINDVDNYLNHSNWDELWSLKIDYIENQLNELNNSSIIFNTIDYYIGLCENAIYYVNNVKKKYNFEIDKLVLSHKKIYYPLNKIDYMNPLNIISDYEVRDVAEYIKCLFWNEGDAFLELQTYLKSRKLSIFLYNMLFARLLYPSFFFNDYEYILNSGKNEEILLKYVDKSYLYEDFLKKAYLEIAKYAPLENIKYFIKN